MADATDSKSVARKGVWVQVPPPVLSSPGRLWMQGVVDTHEIRC